MQNYIKKIIVGIVAFVFLLVGNQNVLASGVWNGQSGDCSPSVAIGVYGDIQRDNYGCWTETSVTAEPGDTINIAMYYHNNTSSTLNNVSGQITKTGSGTRYTFTGRMYSDQGTQTLGSVTLNLTSSQTLTYSSSHWMKDADAVENDEDTKVIYSDGGKISFGSVPSGWDDFGELLVVYKVGENTAPKLCEDSSASNYKESLPCEYPEKVCRDTEATNYGGSLPCRYEQTNPTGNLSANPTHCTISKGYSTCSLNLSWSTQNPVGTSSVTKSGNQTVTTGNTGSKTVNVASGDTDFYLYNNSILLDETSVSASCASGSEWNGNYCKEILVIEPTYSCEIVSFEADSNSVVSGDSVTLSWNTENCTSVNISNIGTNLPASGERTIYPTKTTTYTLTANTTNGTKPSRSLKVNVSGVASYACSIKDFSANDTSIDEGDYATLVWNVEDCDNISISNIGNVSDSGSKKVYPTSDTTYTITAYDNNSTRQTKTVKIYVDEDNDDDEDDDDNDDDDSCSISSFTASDTSVSEGDKVKLKWNTDSCDYIKITDLGSVDDDGSDYVYPENTTTYELTAYNSGESKHYKKIRIYVDEYDNPIVPVVVYNSSVVTTLATGVSQTGANLNGIVRSSKSGNVNTYFEYGTSVNLGQKTNSKTVNGNSNFSEYVTGLNSNTVYFFRAVSSGSNGTSKGAIEVFQTLGVNNVQNTTKYVYVGGTTVTGESSPIMLQIENKYESIDKGDVIDYVVTYKNISKKTLKDSVLQVIVPKGVTITNASEGTYSNDTHTLSVELDDLTAGEEGVVYVQGYVKSIPTDQAKIVSTAVLVYTNTNEAQENAIAYVLNTPKGLTGSVLGASAFFSGFLGFGFIGWLLVIILILLIILIVRRLSEKREEQIGR